jgi:[ribosomal protein S5]-alanine N-acetyltransferase
MPGVDSIETPRLIARRMTDDDFAELCRMHKDPTVMATLGGVRTDEQTRQFLREHVDHWDRHGFGIWMFHDRTDNRFVGRGGLRHVMIEGQDEIELAYALRSESWGKGLATEMAKASVGLGFETLELKYLIAFTLPTNWGSRRVMEKLGFTFERDIVHAAQSHVLYRRIAPVKEQQA